MEETNAHSKTHSWPGWAEAPQRRFGLELQSPFAEYLLNGRKTIETRSYTLPFDLLSSASDLNDGGRGRGEVRIDILESAKGKDGVSAIPNVVSLDTVDPLFSAPASLVCKGWCTFIASFRYTSREEFYADVDKHLVSSSSGYGWSEERPIYGWVVGNRGRYSSGNGHGDKMECVRRMRSIFELRPQREHPTILILGASGMLGRALHRLLLRDNDSYEIIGTGHTRVHVDHYPKYLSPSNITVPKTAHLHRLDLLDFRATTEFLQEHRPNIIVHCAAERRPDVFETHLEESMRLNVESTAHIARECKRLALAASMLEDEKNGVSNNRRCTAGPYLIYISTSYVFDGGVISKVYPPYKPGAKAHPINNYGRSKWLGECAVRNILNGNPTAGERGGATEGPGLIVRIPLLYGEDCCDLGESPALEMAKLFLPGAPVTKTTVDHWSQRFPTSAEDVSRALKLMIDQLLLEHQLPGDTYHISSEHRTTKFELMQLQAKILNVPPSQVEGRVVGEISQNSAPRPQCTQLDCSETWKALGSSERPLFEFVQLEEGMRRALHGFPERFVE